MTASMDNKTLYLTNPGGKSIIKHTLQKFGQSGRHRRETAMQALPVIVSVIVSVIDTLNLMNVF